MNSFSLPLSRLFYLGVLYAALVGVVHRMVLPSAAYEVHPSLLTAALLFDLTVWPLLGLYIWVARPRGWSAVRLGLVGLTLLRLAFVWLPGVPASTGTLWPMLPAGLEAAAVFVVAWRIRTVRQTYCALRRTHDVETALHGALATVFGERAARLMGLEGEIVYYALLAWRKPANVPMNATPITTHHESGQLALLWGLLGISLIELVAVHLALACWSPTVAGWVTGCSAYGCLLMLAVINTIRVRPSYLTAEALHLRLDLRWQAVIQRSQVASMTLITDKLPKHPDTLNAALLTAPNLLVTLRDPIQVRGLYSLKRNVKRITLFVDEPSLFLTGFTGLKDLAPLG